jgi:hypothetical protein
MKRVKHVAIAFLFFMSFAAPAYAWVYSAEASVKEIIAWEGSGQIVFVLSSGTVCYIKGDEKNMYGLILSMFMSGKRANVHCYDNAESIGGISAHRLHRFIAAAN